MKKIIFTLLLMLTVTVAQEPSFVIKDSGGKSIHVIDLKQGLLFEEYKGKAIFLLMFGHDCPPCKEEMPELIELSNKYKDKLAIIAIEVQGYKSGQLEEFRRSNGIGYHLISGEDNKEFVQHIFRRSGWKGQIPFLIAIDKRGEVKEIKAGLIKKDKLEEFIRVLNR